MKKHTNKTDIKEKQVEKERRGRGRRRVMSQ